MTQQVQRLQTRSAGYPCSAIKYCGCLMGGGLHREDIEPHLITMQLPCLFTQNYRIAAGRSRLYRMDYNYSATININMYGTYLRYTLCSDMKRRTPVASYTRVTRPLCSRQRRDHKGGLRHGTPKRQKGVFIKPSRRVDAGKRKCNSRLHALLYQRETIPPHAFTSYDAAHRQVTHLQLNAFL